MVVAAEISINDYTSRKTPTLIPLRENNARLLVSVLLGGFVIGRSIREALIELY